MKPDIPYTKPSITSSRCALEKVIQELAANLAQVSGLSPEFTTPSSIRLRRHQELTAAGFLDEELRWIRR